MIKKSPRIMALLVAALMIAATTAGCQKTKTNDTTSTDDSKPLTLDVFSTFANFSGDETGWYDAILKKKFNIHLNIIHGDTTLQQTRAAAGNLGDIVAFGAGDIPDFLKANLLLDMNKNNLLKDYGQDILKYPAAVAKFQKAYNTGDAVYAIPNSVSSQSPTSPSELGNLTFGIFVPWELYTAIGSPKLNTADDLLPMLKQMADKRPQTSDGKKTYAFSLFKDWDGIGMCLAQQLSSMYGWASQGPVEYNSQDLTQTKSYIDPDSYYMKSLKMYFEANQEGLLDPDSTTQNWDTMSNKYQNAQILFSWWSFLGMPTYNTAANTGAGKGYAFVPIGDEKVLSNGNTPAGSTYAMAIGSQCKDPVRAMKLVDWFYSPDGVEASSNGPEGLTWTKDNGKAVVTAFGLKAFTDPNTVVPAEYGGGAWKDGGNQVNFSTVSYNDIDPNTKEPYNHEQWLSYKEAMNTKLTQEWSQAMGGATDMMDYLKKNNQLAVMMGTDYVSETEPDDIKAIENQCKNILEPDSYKMVFAKSQAEFNSIYNDMVKQLNGLGFQKVVDFYKGDLAKHQQAIDNAKASLSK